MKQLLVVLLSLFAFVPSDAQETISLSGFWEYSLADSAGYAGEVTLPGVLPVKGDRISLRHSVYVPGTWDRKRIFLYLERPLFETNVYVNGYQVGGDSILSVPHRFDITKALKLGTRNTIVVSGRPKGHVVGITGLMELRSHDEDLHIRRVRVYPQPYQNIVQVETQLEGSYYDLSYYPLQVLMQRANVDSAAVTMVNYEIENRHMILNVPAGKKIDLWDEFTPNLYQIGVSAGYEYYETTFGMRELAREGEQLLINRRPLYLRGVVERHTFSEGYPPTDERPWKTIFQRYKDCGVNLVYFADYCPTDAAFTAADKLGLMLYPADSLPMRERILDTYGDHPSLLPVLPHVQRVAERDICKERIEALLADSLSAGFLLPCIPDSIVASKMHQYCSALVPLAHLSQKTYTSADTLKASVECYNALYGDIRKVQATYFISNENHDVLASGLLYTGGVPLGPSNPLGEIVVPLEKVVAPQRLTLTIVLSGNKYVNQWDFMVNNK